MSTYYKYRVLITDVTLYGDKYCVAGWDIDDGGMVRLEPPDSVQGHEASKFWTSAHAGPGKLLYNGNIVGFDARNPPKDFAHPHASEDRILQNPVSITLLNSLSENKMITEVKDSLSPNIESIFSNQIIIKSNGKAYVPAGAKVRSLGALNIRPEYFSFHQETSFGKRKLRAYLGTTNQTLDLSVPAEPLRSLFHSGGADALQKLVSTCKILHVRIGLCRPLPALPDQCYLQVNGVYFLK